MMSFDAVGGSPGSSKPLILLDTVPTSCWKCTTYVLLPAVSTLMFLSCWKISHARSRLLETGPMRTWIMMYPSAASSSARSETPPK